MNKKKRLFFLAVCLCLCCTLVAVGCRKKGNGDVHSGSSERSVSDESFQSSVSIESFECSEPDEEPVISETSESVESGGNPWSDENVDGGAWT